MLFMRIYELPTSDAHEMLALTMSELNECLAANAPADTDIF